MKPRYLLSSLHNFGNESIHNGRPSGALLEKEVLIALTSSVRAGNFGAEAYPIAGSPVNENKSIGFWLIFASEQTINIPVCKG
jgi:hypothetical protein